MKGLRVAELEVAAAATSVEHTSDTARLVLPPSPGTICDVAAICVAETACCAQTQFLLEVTASQVTLTIEAPGSPGLLATASECSLLRVRRWREEGTLLRAYLSHDGALMLADPVLSGNAACEPATTATWQDPKPAISHDQSPSDDS